MTAAVPGFQEVVLCRVLRSKFRDSFATPLRRSDDLHLLPVVRKLFAAIEACDIRSSQRSGLGAAHRPANRNWKAETRVMTTKKDIDKSFNH